MMSLRLPDRNRATTDDFLLWCASGFQPDYAAADAASFHIFMLYNSVAQLVF